MWGERDAKARGPKPGLTLEAILSAAVTLADREGLPSLSMQRLSSELGFSTMALYRYVERKDDLLDLMLDHVMAAPPTSHVGNWRAALEQWALAEWTLLRTHPWVLELVSNRGIVGPNRMAWLAAAFAAMTPAGLTTEEVLQTVMAIDRYVRGTARDALVPTDDNRPNEAWWAEHGPFVGSRFPALAAGLGPLATRIEEPETELAFGLALILDGIESQLARKAIRPSRTHE